MRSLSILLLSYKRLTISYNWPYITIYKSVSAILVSPYKVITAVNNVVTNALGGILFNFVDTITR